MKRRFQTRWALLSVVVAGLIVFLVVWPVFELSLVALEELGGGFGDPERAARAVRTTVAVGVLVALVSATMGTAGALVTERSNVAGKRWLRMGFLLPILIPPFVSALSWLRAYGPGGLTDDFFGWHMPGLQGLTGIVVVIAVNASPLAYLLTAAAIGSTIETDLERAARVSGSGPLRAFGSITFPLLAPALAGAAALTFVLGINAFGVPAVLGSPAGVRTVTTLIYEDLALSARPEAFSRAILLAMGLVVAALLFVLIAEAWLRPVTTSRRGSVPTGPPIGRARPRRLAAYAIWSFVAITSVLPLVALILAALTRGVGLAPTPGNWTFANFAEALDGRLLSALGRSLLLASLAATAGVLLGAAVSLLRDRRLGGVYGVAVLLTFAVPGSTLAVGMFLSHGGYLRGTMTLIFIAYVAKLWAVGHRAISGSAGILPPELYFAARSFGASATTAVRSVVIPLLRPALIGGWILIFLISFHELTMSSLLYGPGSETLAVSILNLQQLGDVPVTSALAVILTIPLMGLATPVLTPVRVPRRFLTTG